MKGFLYNFSLAYETIKVSDEDIQDIKDIQTYLMEKHNTVYMPRIYKQMFIVFVLALLSFGGSLAIKFISMNYQPYIFRSTLSDLNPDEFHYSPFISSMKRCNETCNTVGDCLVEYLFLVKWKT